MDTVIRRFRTALGGFNRQDVQQYITQAAAAHRREIEELQERLKQAQERGAALEAALSGAESEKGSAAAAEARTRNSLEISTRALSHLRGELSQTETKLVAARQELERLQDQVGTLEPMAAGYAQLKDRVATVELEAHRKAQETVSQAQAEGERIRTEARQWLEGVQAQYVQLRQGMDVLLGQYSQMRQGMDALLEQAQSMGRTAEQVESSLDETARFLRVREQLG